MTMISIETLHPSLGAAVRGVDLRALDDAAFARILEAFHEHLVLVFPDQHLDHGDQVAFSRRFGDLEVLPEEDKRDTAFPEIYRVSNVGADDRLMPADHPTITFLSGTQRWHTDSSYREIPSLASLLYAVEVPPQGGQTQFANMYAAYEALDPDERAKVDGLRAVHSYAYSRAYNPNQPPMTAQERAALPPIAQPLARTHPVTGRKALYLGGHASHIEEWPIEDGRAYLADLLAQATSEAFVYTHRWSPNDLVVWDNRCTLHRLRPYEIAQHRRMLFRTSVKGDGPAF